MIFNNLLCERKITSFTGGTEKFLMSLFRSCLLVLFVSVISISLLNGQQKEIVIDDDLAATAEKMKVKMGAQVIGKIMKFKFGNYAVTDSKNGWTTSTGGTNFLETKARSETNNEFSFELTDKSLSEKAIVNAASSMTSEEIRSFNLFSTLAIGSDELVLSTHNFSAFISTSLNEEDVWVLIKSLEDGSQANYEFRAFLTSQDRTISIERTTSNKEGQDSRSIPAKGYEFIENGKSLCAVQYYGGGMMGMNKNIIWIRSELSAKEKLILASAMTALLQVDYTATFSLD